MLLDSIFLIKSLEDEVIRAFFSGEHPLAFDYCFEVSDFFIFLLVEFEVDVA
jgi:hypothetical protein